MSSSINIFSCLCCLGYVKLSKLVVVYLVIKVFYVILKILVFV